jgi:hypothetical protein
MEQNVGLLRGGMSSNYDEFVATQEEIRSEMMTYAID